MLMLIFKLGDEQYFIEAGEIVEIAPLVSIRKIPLAPQYVSGLINYRGSVVPVIDICSLVLNRPCRPFLSTRIVIVNYRYKANQDQTLGIKAENVTEIVDARDSDLVDSGVNSEASPYFGKVISEQSGIVQRININKLLSEKVSESLFEKVDDNAD